MTLPPSTPPPPEPGWPAWDGDAVLAGLDPDTAGLDPDAVADRDEPTDAELAGEYRCAGDTTGPSRHPGWTLTQPQPGTLVWTTPHGRSYTVTPSTYLS